MPRLHMHRPQLPCLLDALRIAYMLTKTHKLMMWARWGQAHMGAQPAVLIETEHACKASKISAGLHGRTCLAKPSSEQHVLKTLPRLLAQSARHQEKTVSATGQTSLLHALAQEGSVLLLRSAAFLWPRKRWPASRYPLISLVHFGSAHPSALPRLCIHQANAASAADTAKAHLEAQLVYTIDGKPTVRCQGSQQHPVHVCVCACVCVLVCMCERV